VACRPQSNPRSTSSDGVPPELEILGFRRLPGAPVRISGLTGLRREAAGADRFDDLAARSSAFECVTRFCVNKRRRPAAFCIQALPTTTCSFISSINDY